MIYKRLCVALLVSCYLCGNLFAEDEVQKGEQSSLKVVPVISSNPTAGTGGGVMASLTYKADPDSSPSQAILSAQYTNTQSYSLFAINKLFLQQIDGSPIVSMHISITIALLPSRCQ